TATFTSSGNPVVGARIFFSLNGLSVGSVLTDASGVATLNNASLQGLLAGVYPSGILASFAGHATYAAAAATAQLTAIAGPDAACLTDTTQVDFESGTTRTGLDT